MSTASDRVPDLRRHFDRGVLADELIITRKMAHLVTHSVGEKRVARLRQLQKCFLIESLRLIQLGREELVYDRYSTLCREIADLVAPEVEMAPEFAEAVQNRDLVVVTNHIGLAKATKLTVGELRVPGQTDEVGVLPNDEPFMFRTALVRASLEAAHDGPMWISEVQMHYAGLLSRLQAACGACRVWVDGLDRSAALFAELKASRAKVAQRGARSVALFFPEAGTTGKRSVSGDPLRLEPFRSAFARFADSEHLLLAPVVQVVEGGGKPLKVRFLPPREARSGDYQEQASDLRLEMQDAIDDLRHPRSV